MVASSPAASHSPAAAALSDEEQSLDSPLYRLSRRYNPVHYDMEFFPMPWDSCFYASVSILFEVREPCPVPSPRFVLHARRLSMNPENISLEVVDPSTTLAGREEAAARRAAMSSNASRDDGTACAAAAAATCVQCVNLTNRVDTSETVELIFCAPLPNNAGDRFVLHMGSVRGLINDPDETEGLYRSSTRDGNVLATHLEPTAARQLYPCYDEPCFHATYSVCVVAEAPYVAVSNTAVEREEPFSVPHALAAASSDQFLQTRRLRRFRFARTTPLHSCILGFVVGKFLIVEQQSRRRGVLCRVLFPHTQPQHAGWFALDLLTKAVDFFDDYFEFALPLRKLDLVAVEEFHSLGMENWGLIIIRMDHLLVTEATSLERRQRITRLIGHEVCHHWFGDWASIAWWPYLWLKEGMCRYLEYFFTDAVSPSWCMWSDFLSNILDSVLVADANPATTHPVQHCDPRPRKIHSSFDSISYGKGAALLRMLFTAIDVKCLKKAGHLLMLRHGNSCFGVGQFAEVLHEAQDLIAGSDDAEGTSQKHRIIDNVLAMAQTPGHPYVLVQQAPGGGYTVSQYHMPLLHRGVLPLYVRQQRQKHGARAIDLLTQPASASFEWDPAKALRGFAADAAVALPIRALKITPATPSATSLWPGAGGRGGRGGFGAQQTASLPFTASVCDIFLDGQTTEVPHATSSSTAVPANEERGEDAQPAGSSPVTMASAASSGTTEVSSVSFVGGRTALYYFNYGGSGAFRCDYDIATWRRVFELAPYLKDEDRMTITTTLARLRNINVGHFAYERAGDDRCTLFLEWVMTLSQLPSMMNSFLWDYLTHRLEELVYMTQNNYCGRIFRAFVSSVYQSLHQRCMLSFFSRDKTVSFQSRLHLSRGSLDGVMQLLALCGSPLVRAECQEVATWALAAMYPHSPLVEYGSPFNGSGDGASDNDSFDVPNSAGAAASPPQAVAAPHVPGRLPSFSTAENAGTQAIPIAASSATLPLSSSGVLLSSAGSPSAAAAGLMGSVRSGAGTPSRPGLATPASAPSVRPPHGAAHVDFANESHCNAVSVALQYLVQAGDCDVWARAAGVVAAMVGVDVSAVERTLGVPIPTPPALDMTSEMQRLSAVLPAFLSLDDDGAFAFMADAVCAFRSVTLGALRAFLRNTRFLTYLLENRLRTMPERVLHAIIICGADLCSNGHVITLLKASMLYHANSPTRGEDAGTAPDAVLRECRVIDFMDEGAADDSNAWRQAPRRPSEGPAQSPVASPGAGGEGSATTPAHRAKKRLLPPSVATAFDIMESNCIWMDYCSDHVERYLQEQRSRRVWAPLESQTESHGTSTANEFGGSAGGTRGEMSDSQTDGLAEFHGPIGGVSI